MARVVVTQPLAGEFFAGREEFQLAAATLFDAVRLLDSEAPGFAEAAEMRAAFAVDGAMTPDWSTPVGPDAQILVIARIAGG